MTFVFKRALALLALLLSLGVAMAAGPTGGPSPPPSPWTINGNSISYGGCVLVPVSVTGGCLGSGAINASAIYVNGVAVGSPSLVVGSTPVTGGVSGRILYDNAGKIGELATTGAGTVVLSTSPTLVTPVLGTPTSVTLTNATGLVLTAGAGVTGILPTANGGTGLGTFTANLPLIGNGTGNLAQGTISGNTTKFATVSGTINSGHCAQFDSSGNVVDAGGACTTGGGGGTVSAGTINQIAIYAATGTAVSGMTIANNAVVVTNGTGVPSEATTLPSGLTIPSPTLTTPAIGAATGTSLNVTGGLTAGAASGLTFGSVQTLFVTTNYVDISDTAANPAFLFGNATDPTNYSDNTTHSFRNRAGTSTFASIVSGGINLNGTTSGSTEISPAATASGVWTLPSTTDQFVGRNTTDTLTNKTLPALTFGAHLISGGSSYTGAAVTITSDATNANTASTIVARDGSGNFTAGTITAALTGHASSDLALSGGTLTGALTTVASATGGAGLILPQGTAPTSPVNGALWTTSAGVFAQIAGATVGPFGTGGGGGGGTACSQNFHAGTDFTAGTTTTLTTSCTVANAASLQVNFDGVSQTPGDTWTLSGSVVTFAVAIPAGTQVVYFQSYGVVGTGVLGPNASTTNDIAAFNNTSGSILKDSGIAASALALLNVADQTLSGGANVTSFTLGTATGGTTTIDCGKSPQQFLTNGGAFTFAAPANDGNCIVLLTNNGSAGAVAFSGFTEGSNVGDALDTTNTHKFSVSVYRINSVSHYLVSAYQ